MKNRFALFLALLVFLSMLIFTANAQDASPASDTVTIRSIIENKEFPEGKALTVTVVSFENPVLAVVKDSSGESINLFGVFVNGEMESFDMEDIGIGRIITIINGKYNEFEGAGEIVEAELIAGGIDHAVAEAAQ